ncbi:MAG: hypothetical protein ACI86L_001544, partial [Dokdonia sp.]
ESSFLRVYALSIYKKPSSSDDGFLYIEVRRKENNYQSPIDS